MALTSSSRRLPLVALSCAVNPDMHVQGVVVMPEDVRFGGNLARNEKGVAGHTPRLASIDQAGPVRRLPARLPDKIKAFIEEKQAHKYIYRASIMLVDTWLGHTLQPDDALLSAYLVGADEVQPLVPPRGFPHDASRYVVEEATVPVLYDKQGNELTCVEPLGDGRHWRLITLRELKEGPIFGWLTLDEVETLHRLVGERHLPLKIAVEKMRTLNQPRVIFWTIPSMPPA